MCVCVRVQKSLPALRMTLLNSQQSLTQLAQTSSSSLTVSAIKAPPPRSLTTTVPAVRPTGAQDQASLMVLSINITYTEVMYVSKQCNTFTIMFTFFCPLKAVKRTGPQTGPVRMPVVITQSVRPQGA